MAIALVLLLLGLGVGSASVILPLAAPSEELIEGHTVFTLIEPVRNTTKSEHFAAAVAVLVRQQVIERNIFRAPWVLWFNDQYLVDPDPYAAYPASERYLCPDPTTSPPPSPPTPTVPPSLSSIPTTAPCGSEADGGINDTESQLPGYVQGYGTGIDPTDPSSVEPPPPPLPQARGYRSESANFTRYPCNGAIIAVNQGDSPPPGLATYPLDVTLFAGTYVESYYITDPNDHPWNIDKWDLGGRPVWTVGMGAVDNRDQPDDGGSNCSPYQDNAAHGSSTNGYGYPCGGKGGPSCKNKLAYNAVLYFLLDDLDQPGTPKDHTKTSADYANDVSGCDDKYDQYFQDNWPCPSGDDNREGNSHTYCVNTQNCKIPGNPGRSTHGWSADCDGDMVNDYRCHATRFVDIYYGVAPVPASRDYAILDVEGKSSPYICEQDPLSGNPGYDYCTVFP